MAVIHPLRAPYSFVILNAVKDLHLFFVTSELAADWSLSHSFAFVKRCPIHRSFIAMSGLRSLAVRSACWNPVGSPGMVST